MLLIGEAGWTPDQWGHSRFKTVNASGDNASNQKSLTMSMRALLKASLRFFQSSSYLGFILIEVVSIGSFEFCWENTLRNLLLLALLNCGCKCRKSIIDGSFDCMC